MELDSLQFWLFFFAAVFILMFRSRKNRPTVAVKPRGVTARVFSLHSPLHHDTPLACLLDDTKRFGPLFQEKEPPVLPHGPSCECVLTESFIDSNQLYSGKAEKEVDPETDLGPLGKLQRRYYRYRLILSKPDCPVDQTEEIQNLILPMDLDPKFQEQVNQHLEGKL